jgi:tRNA(adenine34) deaminase
MADNEYFMKKALVQAQRALGEGEFPVGCVMAYQNEILVTGTRKGTVGENKNEIDHAEMVALRRLVAIDDPIDHSKIDVFCTMEPCLMCYSALILAGIGKIVFAYEDVMGGGTGCDLTQLNPLYNMSSIEVVRDVLRNESLLLFKAYFSDPANLYWKDSLLAQYTLNQ